MAGREPRPSATFSITSAEHEPIHQRLRALGGADEPAGPYELWRVKLTSSGRDARAILYQSGKLVVSGHAPAYDEITAAVGEVGKRVPPKPRASAVNVPNEPPAPAETEPHIGTDEAGKGDFFGPMITAGVYVDARTAQILRTLGVRDSKTVSDRELRGLATSIRQTVAEGQRAVLVLAPHRYNELYRQMRSEGKNLNTMLAWTHTRVIEDLIRAGLRPQFILSDQFGDKRYIESRLLAETRLSGIPLIQMHRAEADVGVAAASILARDGFLRWMEQTSRTLGVTLPKGASPNVIATARELVRRQGADALKEYAKVSFKTMEKVLAP